MITEDRRILIVKLEKIRQHLCAYSFSENFCDCKFGSETEELSPKHERFSGCCEIRQAIEIIEGIEQRDTSEIEVLRDKLKSCEKLIKDLLSTLE